MVYLYQMVTQNMLRKCKGKYGDLIKCLKQIAQITEIAPYLQTYF